MSRHRASVLGGIGFVVLATACFAMLDTTAKYVSLSVPILMAIWVRYLVQAILSTAVLLPVHGRALFHTAQPRLQLVRGLLLLASTVVAFYSLALVPVAEFTAILMVTPLAVTVLAVTVLKDKVGSLHWLFVATGFAGTLIIVRPGQSELGWAGLLPLGCVVTNSAFQLLTSHLGKTEKAATTHFFSTWVGALLSSLALPFIWSAVDSPRLWALMLLMGAVGAAGHFALTLAYERARAVTLVPYLYSSIAFSVFGGWLVFAQLPDAWAWVGIGLITVSGICGAWLSAREHSVIAQLPES